MPKAPSMVGTSKTKLPKTSLLALFHLPPPQGSPTNLGQARQSALMGPSLSSIKSEFKSGRCQVLTQLGRAEEQREILIWGWMPEMSAPWTRVAAFPLALRGQDFPQRAPQMVFVCSGTMKKENIWCKLLADRHRHMVGARRAWMLREAQARLCSSF